MNDLPRLSRRDFLALAAAAAAAPVNAQDLPRALLIGDSISIGYTEPTRKRLRGMVDVQRIPVNGGPTILGLEKLEQWLQGGKWDVIHFNWGLHDLKMEAGVAHQVPIDRYEANLRQLVTRLEQTGARLIWATTTPVPDAQVSPPRRNSDVLAYNAVARKIMDQHHIPVNDLYSEAFSKVATIQLPANVHFNAQGYDALAERVAVAILSALGWPIPKPADVFVAGVDGYHSYRIPSLIATSRGTLLAFCEGRKSGRADTGDIDLVLKRSLDNGATWQPMQPVAEDGPNTVGNPCPVVGRDTGTIWLPFTRNLGEDTQAQIMDRTSKGTREAWITKSTDDGATWSKPVEITPSVKDREWTWYATGPGCGIQLRSGRLLIPCDHAVAGSKIRRSHVIYSDDHGDSWKLGGILGDNTNECQVVELADGSLLINMRSYHGKNRRAIATSKDGGLSWSEVTLDGALIEPVCQAALVRFGGRTLVFSNPASERRERMTVRISEDDGKTWPYWKLLHAGPSAYSALVVLPYGTVGCLFERGESSAYERISFTRFSDARLRQSLSS